MNRRVLFSAFAVVFCLSVGGPWVFAAPDPATVPAAPVGYEDVVRPFVAQNCLRCHGEKTAKAGYRIDRLSTDFSAPSAADGWKEVIDRINAGEMPPEEAPRPDPKQAAAFVEWVNRQLREVDLVAKKAGGRIPMRRLNRDEYANTVRDLLTLDENLVRPLTEELPADGTAEGFDRLGVALFFDQTQVERNLTVAAKVAGAAIVAEPPKVNRLVNRFEQLRRRPPPDMVEVFPGFTHTIPRGAQDRFVRADYIEIIQGSPTYRREWDGWGIVDHFSVRDVVKQDGYYRVRVHAKVDNRSRSEPNKFVVMYAKDSPIQVVQEMAFDPLGVSETIVFLRGPVNGEIKGPQVMDLLWNHTEKAVIPEPGYQKLFSAWTGLRGKMERAAVKPGGAAAEMAELQKQRDELERQMNAWDGPWRAYNPAFEVDKLPRLLIESIEVEGPIQPHWPPASHKALGIGEGAATDAAQVRQSVASFLPRAYRRPVTPAEIDEVVAVFQTAQAGGQLSYLDAMRGTLEWILCSPSFQFINEPSAQTAEPRRLNDYELATRLSYFLWSTMPDDRLFELAAAGKLHDPPLLAAELERMLADAKAGHFVQNFAGQWLSVRDYGSVQPAAEYKSYDKPLERASKQEPLAFFAEVLAHDLPITSFIDSDFLVINERLAEHYGISGVSGPEFRRVAIMPEQHRGGVLGMAGLMTWLADGTRTLPMRRGSWVLREVLGDPPNNPPPNAGEIQPNTSGKNLTVRQRLELHRRDEICASCHAKLDPYGLALENYDAIGHWRERFNGEGFHGNNAPLLNVGGAFPDGRKFATLEEYKSGLLAQKERFARAFSSKLLTYALGRPVGYTDHQLVDSLVNDLKQHDYRIRSLILGIVVSEPFNSK